jgi:hypothetical protein
MKRQQSASLSLTSRDSSIHAKQQRCFKFIRRRFSVSLAKAEIRAMRIGKLWRFRTSDLDAWVDLRLKLSSYPCRP